MIKFIDLEGNELIIKANITIREDYSIYYHSEKIFSKDEILLIRYEIMLIVYLNKRFNELNKIQRKFLNYSHDRD
jgi:Sec7-like guanine-nucleotide exchange factor